MYKHLTIKQIADLAGVSTGTVDRVLHNRGMVSPAALEAVNKVLENKKYEYNLHTSAIAFKKTKKVFKIVVSIPSSDKGEYWDLMRQGIESGFNEFGDIPVDCEFIHFDQFDSESCAVAFDKVARSDCNAVILGTTFASNIQSLCEKLDRNKTPYVFVDGNVPDTKPVATFAADQESCGRLLARLIDGFTPGNSDIAVLLPRRKGTQMSTNSSIRLKAFKSYFSEKGDEGRLKEGLFSISDTASSTSDVRRFLNENPTVKSIAVMISASYMICDALSALSVKDVCVGGFDVTDGNARCLRNGSLDYIIDQHPDKQGFNSVEAVLRYLLYGQFDVSVLGKIPVSIYFDENL